MTSSKSFTVRGGSTKGRTTRMGPTHVMYLITSNTCVSGKLCGAANANANANGECILLYDAMPSMASLQEFMRCDMCNP